jgi:hypothetical protein
VGPKSDDYRLKRTRHSFTLKFVTFKDIDLLLVPTKPLRTQLFIAHRLLL